MMYNIISEQFLSYICSKINADYEKVIAYWRIFID